MLLGMDSIRLLGGVQVSIHGHTIKLNVGERNVGVTAAPYQPTDEICLPVFEKIIDKDFIAEFKNGSWCVSWNWLIEAPTLKNKIPNYRTSENIKNEYGNEVKVWIKQG